MKKFKLLVIAFIVGIVSVKANPIDVNVAQKVAENFYASNHAAGATLTLTYTERDAAGQPVYYVFNVNSTTKGFVIVTADDAAHPIIGYSDEGAFVIPTANSNAYFWLQKRKNEVIAMRAHNIVATSDIAGEWTTYTTVDAKHAAHNVASMFLCKTVWDQSPFYYNGYCPGGSVTGCVATAMAQIMKYWSYPSIGSGSHCYDETFSHGYSENYGELCATFDTSHYMWAAMANDPKDTNRQIEKLMYDCGVSVDMNYSPTGSGAQVMGGGPSAYNSYTAYFGYDASTIGTAGYDNTQQASWIALLKNEIDNKRPMQFQGFDVNEGGHSWVCDGYTALNTFHMNWGWNGMDDGFFAVNSLNPSPFNFTYNIAVIYGIQPPPGALGVEQISNNTAVTVYPNPSHGVFNFTMTNDNSTYRVNVYNVLGQQINTSIINSGNIAINLSAQSKGVYIYKILTETGSLVSAGRLVVE